jgi:hypothetical protein
MPSNLTAKPTKGDCYFAFVFHVDRGRYGDLGLDGLNFAVVGYMPGAMAAGLGPLIGKVLGAETKPIHFQKSGLRRSVSIPGALDEEVEGVASPAVAGEPLYLDNTVHPANKRLALAQAKRSHLHVFGLNWDDTSGKNNGHFASFAWQG